MKYIDIEQMNEACTHEYNENYAHGGYCHEQSFRFGFQEGVEFCENEMIDKACDVFQKMFLELRPDFIKIWRMENEFRKRLEE